MTGLSSLEEKREQLGWWRASTAIVCSLPEKTRAARIWPLLLYHNYSALSTQAEAPTAILALSCEITALEALAWPRPRGLRPMLSLLSSALPCQLSRSRLAARGGRLAVPLSARTRTRGVLFTARTLAVNGTAPCRSVLAGLGSAASACSAAARRQGGRACRGHATQRRPPRLLPPRNIARSRVPSRLKAGWRRGTPQPALRWRR
jgi:hypothetical protein